MLKLSQISLVSRSASSKNIFFTLHHSFNGVDNIPMLFKGSKITGVIAKIILLFQVLAIAVNEEDRNLVSP